MTRDEIIQALKKNFDIRELVCPDVFKKFGERSWMFFTIEILHTLLVLRTDILNVPLFCNNWQSGGQLKQRGLRCNLCDEISRKTFAGELAMSAHANGNAFDLTSPAMTAEEMRKRIQDNWRKLPYPIRIEKDKTWLHVDCYYDRKDNEMIRFFKG